VREAKARNIAVTCEVTPHHLLLTDASVVGYETFCKVNPPLREQIDVDALRAALADGSIDAIATDHAPHSSLEKDCEFSEASPGLMGLELCFGLLMQLVHSGQVPLLRLVHALSTGPARVVGIAPPSLKEGEKADIALVDPQLIWQPSKTPLQSKSRNTPFLEKQLKGRVMFTMAQGEVVFDTLGGAS
jgi:dihydroorotase